MGGYLCRDRVWWQPVANREVSPEAKKESKASHH